MFNLFTKDCMFITFTFDNSKGWPTTQFDSNWAYSWAWGCSTIGVGWSSTSFPPLAPLPHAKSTNSTMLYFASTISSLATTTRKRSLNQHIINNFLLVSTDLEKQLRNQEICVRRINRVNMYLLISTDLGKQLQNKSIMPLKSTVWTFICWFEQSNFN